MEILVYKDEDVERLRIIHSLERPAEDMTVEEICAKAGISKSYFYKLFDSKFTMSVWYSDFCSTFFLENLGSRYTLTDAVRGHLTLIEQELSYLNRMHYDAVIRMEIRASLRSKVLDLVLSALKEKTQSDASQEMVFYVKCFVDILIEEVTRWTSGDFGDLPSETLAQWMINCIPEKLIRAFE